MMVEEGRKEAGSSFFVPAGIGELFVRGNMLRYVRGRIVFGVPFGA